MARPKKSDPLAELAEGIAGDHALAKNSGKVGNPTAPAEPTATTADAAPSDASASSAAPSEPQADTTATEAPPEIEAVDEAEQRRLDRLSLIVEEAQFDSGTAVGDIRDCLRELFKTRDKPWHMLDANGRRDLDNQLTKVAQQVVRKVVLVVAEEDSLSIQATLLEKFTASGDAMELKLKVDHADDEVFLAARKLAGHKVVVLSASDQRFGGARKPNDPGEKQVDMPFADPPVAEETSPADPPADDTDLAAAADDAPQAEETVELEEVPEDPTAPDWAVYDEEAEVYLAANTEADPWTDDADKAMRFTLQEAKDECVTHGEGMIVRRHALASAPEHDETQ